MSTDDAPATDRPITVRTRVGGADDGGEDGGTEIELDAGETTAVLSPTRIELLRAVATAAPESMRAAARLVDRDVKNVHRDLQDLWKRGLVEFEWEGNRRRPVVAFDALEVVVPIREG